MKCKKPRISKVDMEAIISDIVNDGVLSTFIRVGKSHIITCDVESDPKKIIRRILRNHFRISRSM